MFHIIQFCTLFWEIIFDIQVLKFHSVHIYVQFSLIMHKQLYT